ncbi:MAG: LytR C-terminal domain-containing protein [Candidatus Doudnabacteria bacterium]|nr:LytR C-terminal domain-containing protein [Candidatus Doudnabacteria bacterium]
MTPPIISQETKEANFEAIAPLKQEPVLLRTKTVKAKSHVGVFLVLLAVALGCAYWFYNENQTLKAKVAELEGKIITAQNSVSLDGLSPVEKLNKHMLLPQAQSAQVVTIENSKDLKQSDTFYEYAENGDLLIQFPNLEIIYNNTADVIINARTKNTGQVAGAEARALQGALNLEIRNGAGVAGLAGKTAATFSGVKEYVVKSVGNAARGDYSKTVIVNLSGKDVSGLEKQFNTQAVTVLPSGESVSEADVVIIMGKQ